MEPAALTGPRRPAGAVQAWPAALAWLAGAAAMVALQPHVDLGSLAMVLVLTSAMASLWLSGTGSALAAALAVAAFDWFFVPPRYAFAIDLRHDALLLATMLAVSWIVSALMVAQRRHAAAARAIAAREQQLRQWGERLREAAEPITHASALQRALADAAGVPCAVMLAKPTEAGDGGPDSVLVGDADADQRSGLRLTLQQGQRMGPGSERHRETPDAYLPLRGRRATLGAAVLVGLGHRRLDPQALDHAQALCDQMGLALQRAQAAEAERRLQEQAQAQAVRAAFLAAISHDYRTPLATIMGAASSLQTQGERMGEARRRQLAAAIVAEVSRLNRLTDNTLQLVRLDGGPIELRRDWESAEELVGATLARVRQRVDGTRVRARLEPGLPLLWCDATLLSQLLDNLIDNALKHTPAETPVELLVRRVGGDVVLAVRDRGRGVAPASRERIFDVFRRAGAGDDDAEMPAGSGIGLALCRAIARAHGGEMRLRQRSHGGSSFECWLPVRDPPPTPGAAEEAA